MKNYFSLNVNVKDFLKIYIVFYLLVVVFGIPGRFFGVYSVVNGFLQFFGNFVSIIFGFVAYRFFISRTSYQDSTINCSGKTSEFALKVLLWLFLTIITAGIYTPWLIRNVVSYYLKNTAYKQYYGSFLSKPTTLLKYAIIFILIVLAIVGVAALIQYLFHGDVVDLVFNFEYYDSHHGYGERFIATAFPAGILIFLVGLIFFHFYALWSINYSIAGYTFKFKNNWTDSLPVILSQVLLTIISLGIYAPAAFIRVYRYVLSGTKVINEFGAEVGNFGFDTGNTSQGFLLIWGQGILSLITLGLYGPWALCKINTWIVNGTFIQGDVGVKNGQASSPNLASNAEIAGRNSQS